MITVKELISKYPNIFQNYVGNPGQVNWLDLPDGWTQNLDWMCGAIQNYVDCNIQYINGEKKVPVQPTCTQMKEKFGGLRFYTNQADDTVEGMISMTEHMCNNTCQMCGSHENLGVTAGCVSVLCVNCKTDNMLWKARNTEK